MSKTYTFGPVVPGHSRLFMPITPPKPVVECATCGVKKERMTIQILGMSKRSSKTGDILLPEQYSFCSRHCALQWMEEAVKNSC